MNTTNENNFFNILRLKYIELSISNPTLESHEILNKSIEILTGKPVKNVVIELPEVYENKAKNKKTKK